MAAAGTKTTTQQQDIFVWEGLVRESKDRQGAGDDEDCHEFVWDGSWVSCSSNGNQCAAAAAADARTVATPSNQFLSHAKTVLNQQVVHLVAKGKRKGGFWFYNVGSGYILAGSSNSDETRYQEQKDHKHTLMTKHKISRGCVEDYALVVAKGVNNHGQPFISAGYTRRKANDPLDRGPGILLARRYLPKYGDPRAEWSLQELYDRISGCYNRLNSKTNNKNNNNNNNSSSELGVVPIAPWRTLDFHAQYMSSINMRGSKRKREGPDLNLIPPTTPTTSSSDHCDQEQEELLLEQLPPLHMISDEDDFDSTLVVSDKNGLISNAMWLEQCNGCGKEIRDWNKACPNEVITYKSSLDDPYVHEPMDTYETVYCNAECVKTNGARAWAKASHEWRKRLHHHRHHHDGSMWLMKGCVDMKFWEIVASDKNATKLLTDVGWEGPDSWTLHGEDFSDDDEDKKEEEEDWCGV